jgi:hypothetical protein
MKKLCGLEFFILLVAVGTPVYSKVTFENVTITSNPKIFSFFNDTFYPNKSLDMTGELVRILEGKIMVSFKCQPQNIIKNFNIIYFHSGNWFATTFCRIIKKRNFLIHPK